MGGEFRQRFVQDVVQIARQFFRQTSGCVGPRDGQLGFGLFSIRERLRSVGGRFRLDSRPGAGVRVELDEARARMEAMTWEAATYGEFRERFESEPGFCRVWWAGSTADEDRLQLEFTYRLDTEQLPRPMQIGIGSQPDWNLRASRSVPVHEQPPSGSGARP